MLDPVADKEKVRKAVQKERQRLKQAKLLLEEDLQKEFSLKTLKRFLKKGCRYKRIRKAPKGRPSAAKVKHIIFILINYIFTLPKGYGKS